MSSEIETHPNSENMVEVKLFSCAASEYLAERISDYYGQALCDRKISRFSDGEMQTVINESVRGAYVFFIQSSFPPSDNLFELLLFIDAAKRASAGYITAVIPYFGYARQDRKDKPRVPISAKLIANLLQAAGANRIMTMDLHAEQIQGFFDIPVDHLKSEAIFMPYLQSLDLTDVKFASPDVGGVKRARVYAKHFKKDLVICDKYREKANEVAGMTVIGDVQGADVVLVDDLVDTAGTLCKAADALLEKGAKSVRAICTHPVLSGKAYENIEQSSLLEIIVTDTIPLKQKSSKIKVLSTSKLFARAIRNTHEHRSISALFFE
ncbi:MAG TPA: ribose-phosphate pyrophosphokinase [Saprospiraceae bacterium]|nr:ribose-phosphate pyrophosphokinase [Saprospiraceae bacterium]HQU96000.1 ribose-phosphate pyrophosphokinase [Saprospiraceae bacterium]HQW95218.1 ribose-phosphate pyrophosphokinase [Saprospiraceae bacterium]HRG43650.1 ribose-phosphate pyrophosphokinase [Saprospiraceae bacterium]